MLKKLCTAHLERVPGIARDIARLSCKRLYNLFSLYCLDDFCTYIPILLCIYMYSVLAKPKIINKVVKCLYRRLK